MLLDFRQLDALAAVLRTGSFEVAADELCLTGAALSQRIRQLEERIGSVLLVRGQPCSGTAEGLRVLRYAQEVALQEQTLLASLAHASTEKPAIPVSIALNADSLATWFLPAMDGITSVLLKLCIDDMDHGAGMLARGEVVAAVTSEARQIAGCDVYPLGALRYVPVARSDFVQHWLPEGPTAKALARAPTLTYDDKDRLQVSWVKLATGRRIVPPTHIVVTSHGLRNAALAGLGWVMLPLPMAAPELARGRLVTLSDHHPIDMQLTWQVSRLTRGVLDPITQAVRTAAAAALFQPSRSEPRIPVRAVAKK